jgi:citrate synthase
MLLLTGCFGYLSDARRYRTPKPDETVAHAIATSVGIAATPKAVQAIDAALVVCADHELNPSTFVARIAASSEGDLYACIASALSTNSGARIARACDRLDAFFRGPVTLESLVPGPGIGIRDAGVATLGFNHPLYPAGDPRATCLLEVIRELQPRGRRVATILGHLDEAQARHKQLPRIETALSLLTLALGMPVGAASGIVTLARISGWVAHIAEQRLAGFLIRPRAKFVER